MQIPSAIITLVIGMLLVLGGMWVGQNINLLPIGASVNAPIYDELFQVLFTIEPSCLSASRTVGVQLGPLSTASRTDR